MWGLNLALDPPLPRHHLQIFLFHGGVAVLIAAHRLHVLCDLLPGDFRCQLPSVSHGRISWFVLKPMGVGVNSSEETSDLCQLAKATNEHEDLHLRAAIPASGRAGASPLSGCDTALEASTLPR